MPWHPQQVFELARHQCGVVTLGQARARGVTSARRNELIAAGVWRHHLGCLHVLTSPRGSDWTDAYALGLRLGAGAIVTGPTAMRIGGWQVDDRELIAVTTRRHRGIDGVTLFT